MLLPTIRTGRLMLRNIDAGDTDALFRIFGDEGVTRFWGHPALPDRAAAESLVEAIRDGVRRGDLMQWAITREETVVGTCTLAGVDTTHRRADIGVALDPVHRGAGYAEEAVRAVIRHGFDDLGLHRVTADVDPRNEPALRLLARLGFREEGRLREHYRQNDEWQDGILFGLLVREWRSNQR